MAAEPPKPPQRILGFLKSFPKGMNSNIDPLLLPATQLAYATNVSLRGDYPLPRPNFFNLTLVDNTGGQFQAGLFQGSTYYRGATDGSIIVAVNGFLFQIVIASNVATVTQIPLPPGDVGNSQSAPQQWMEQAEQFLIVNDGQNLPLLYDSTTAFSNGRPTRRSLGTSQTPIGTVLSQFTVPPIGQTALVQLSTNVKPSAAGLAYLIGNAQFALDSVTPSTTDPSTNLGTNVLQSAAGDQLLCQADGSSFDGATLYTNSSYLATIATGAAVVQTTGVGNVTDWGQIVAPGPAPTVTVNLAPANGLSLPQFEISALQYSGIAQTCAFLFFKPPILIDVGSTLNLDGVAVKVLSITTYASATYLGTGGHPNSIPAGYLIQKITVQPLSSTQTGALTAVTVTTNDVYSVHINVSAACATRNTKSGVINQPLGISASNGANTWQGAAPSGAAGYFTVKLNEDPAILNTTTQYTFKVFAGNGQPLTFTGFYGGIGSYQLVNCQMTTPPPVSAGYTVQQVAGVATAANQYVQVTKAGTANFNPVLTTVATVYNASVTPTATTYSNVAVPGIGSALVIPVKLGATIVAGDLLFSTAVNGNTDIFVAVTTSQVGGTTDVYGAFVNQSGTPGATIPASTPVIPLPELPPGKMLVYGQGRVWECLPNGTSFVAGDIVGGASGTNIAPTNYNFTDAVLKVSQNQFMANGTTFTIPGAGTQIMALQFVSVLDVSLGQGDLQVFTNNTVFGCDTPSDATTWASLTYPILTESLIGAGGVSQNAVSQVNGDIIFRTSDGNVQSMTMARLDFYKWGVTPISKEITRIIQFDNPLLLPFCSSVIFSNRYLLTSQPHQCLRGVYHTAIAALNFDAVSTLQGKQPSIWEGAYTGLNVLEFVTDSDGNAGTYGGQKRCFALCIDPTLTNIQVVEILQDTAATNDNLTQPVNWSFESPLLFNQQSDDIKKKYKRLVDGEIAIDSITPDGVTIAAYYKPDQNDVWTPWFTTQVNYKSNDTGFRPRIGFGQPTGNAYDTNGRPLREGYDFQVMLVFTGYCRFLGGRFAADLIPQPEFAPPMKIV